MKWMTKKEVMEATGISRYELNAAIESGKLRYQIFKKRMKFTERDVEQWQNDTICYTDYISEAKYRIRKSRSLQIPKNELTLESLCDKYFPKKQRSTATNYK